MTGIRKKTILDWIDMLNVNCDRQDRKALVRIVVCRVGRNNCVRNFRRDERNVAMEKLGALSLYQKRGIVNSFPKVCASLSYSIDGRADIIPF